MEAAQSAADAAISGGSSAVAGGPAPFLLKTYDMIDDSATDDIVSWSSSKSSFVVWNPPEFSSRLLPTYFKHNNFSSFIRQLNTYGFRKIDPERWEFANDEFVQGQKHLLKNIHRRKPIHSHSTPPFGAADGERSALEDEIDRLQREKSALHADLWRFKNQQSGTKLQLEDLDRRQRDMEQRQARMIAFLHRAVQNPKFVENLITMAGSSSSALHKKRRFPVVEFCEVVENNNSNSNSFSEDSCSNSKPAAEVGGHVFSQDFCDKLKLELSPAFSDSNLVCPSNQDSNDGGDRCLRAAAQIDDSCHIRMECLQFVPDALELSDTGASFCPKRNSLVADSFGDGDGDGDELPSFHLNLTLASSSSIQINNSNNNNNHNLSTIPSSIDLCATNDNTGDDCRRNADLELTDAVAVSTSEVSKGDKQAQPVAATARVNDKFWEQFLTERPGSSDTEEASSSLRDDLCEEQQQDRNTIEDMEHLTL